MKNKVFCAIDPGKQGFMVAFSEKKGEHDFYTMPEEVVGTGEFYVKSGLEKTKLQFSYNKFREFIFMLKDEYKDSEMYFLIEDVTGRTGWSAQNNFTFGYVAGVQLMIPIMLGAKYLLVKPQVWQKVMYSGVTKETKKSKSGSKMVHDTKATSEKVAKKLFPNYDFRRTLKSKNTDDNKTDALLMCEYARLHVFKDK